MTDDRDALEAIVEALRQSARVQSQAAELIQRRFEFVRDVPRTPVSHRGPTNPLHQTWRGFVLDMLKLQNYAEREGLKLTKHNVARFGVDTVKTITRTMEWYGLRPNDWPPSRWDPNEDRQGGHAGAKIRH